MNKLFKYFGNIYNRINVVFVMLMIMVYYNERMLFIQILFTISAIMNIHAKERLLTFFHIGIVDDIYVECFIVISKDINHKTQIEITFSSLKH